MRGNHRPIRPRSSAAIPRPASVAHATRRRGGSTRSIATAQPSESARCTGTAAAMSTGTRRSRGSSSEPAASAPSVSGRRVASAHVVEGRPLSTAAAAPATSASDMERDGSVAMPCQISSGGHLDARAATRSSREMRRSTGIRRRGRSAVVAAAVSLVAAGALAGAAHAQLEPSVDASFDLEPQDECIVGQCSPTVIYGAPLYVPGGLRVEVDWDVPGPLETTFAADAAITCGDSSTLGPAPAMDCVLQGPAYGSPGTKTVGLRVTGPDGVPAYSSQPLEVLAQSAADPRLDPRLKPRGGKRRSRGLCPPFQRGVHCGPGNNRRTSGGSGKVSHKGWPAVSGIFWIVQDARGHANGAGTALNDEILGGHGSDRLRGAGGKDILWGDYHPTGNTPRQRDFLSGGAGADFIYTSHGTNRVNGGRGADRIYAHWGHGTI